MLAYRLSAPDLNALHLVDEAIPEPGPSEIIVRMRAASLNFKDTFYLAGDKGIRLPRPTIPLSDGSGEVVAVGSHTKRFSVGDRVIGTFVQDWLYGSIPEHAVDSSTTLGHGVDGCLAEYRAFNEDGLVRLPKNLSYEEGATLACAALTAWNAVRDVRPWETVLVLGTGGVALFALQFVKALGAQAIVTSSSGVKLARAADHGADWVVNYRDNPEWQHEARRITGGRGVNHVVDTVGPATLQQSIAATARDGKVHLVGLISPVGSVNPLSILAGMVSVRGVRVGSRQMFEEMNSFIEVKDIHPIIGHRYAFKDAKTAFLRQIEGPDFGKIVVNMSP